VEMDLPISKFEINQMLDSLTEKWDREIALQIVFLFHTLPFSNGLKVAKQSKSSDSSFTGLTSQHGNVTVKEKKPEYKTTVFREAEENYARIGNYKIEKHYCFNQRRKKDKAHSSILFYNFSKSDISTISLSEDLIHYQIAFENNSLQPVTFVKQVHSPTVISFFGVDLLTHHVLEEVFFPEHIIFNRGNNIINFFRSYTARFFNLLGKAAWVFSFLGLLYLIYLHLF